MLLGELQVWIRSELAAGCRIKCSVTDMKWRQRVPQRLAAADRRYDCHFIARLQLLLLVGPQVLVV